MMKTANSIKTKVDITDFLTLMYWVKTFFDLEGKSFSKYENLLEQAETYKLTNTPLDTTYHPIDELMVDAVVIYRRLVETKDKVSEILDQIKIPMFGNDMLTKEIDKFEVIIKDLVVNYKYEYPEIKGVQKVFLEERMIECVEEENYEEAARIRDMINEC